MRFEEAHFLGGPLDGEVRMIEYVHSHAVPHREVVREGWASLQPGRIAARGVSLSSRSVPDF